MFLFLFPGVHILQSIIGCNVNENSGEVSCFLQFGFNGEGIFEFDPKTKTMNTLKPELHVSEQMMNDHKNLTKYIENLFRLFDPILKVFLHYGSSSLNKTGRSYVKRPSFPCHETDSLFIWQNHFGNSRQTRSLSTVHMCKQPNQ